MRRGLALVLPLIIAASFAPGCRKAQEPSPADQNDAASSPSAAGSAASDAPLDADDPTPVIATRVVQDFETDITLGKWPQDAPQSPELSSAWKVSGNRSLMVPGGLSAAFDSLDEHDWSKYDTLRLHFRNDNTTTSAIELDLQDDAKEFHNRHHHEGGAVPGESTVDFDISGDLWRGNEDFPYRGEVKTPLDKANIKVFSIKNRGIAPLYLDKIELIQTRALQVEGGVVFDFGKTGTRVMRQMKGVFETSTYTPEKGFGFRQGSATGLARSNSLPTPAFGDGLAFVGDVFRVDLQAGRYVGWVAFERGGFWDQEGCDYDSARLLINGEIAHEHSYRRGGQHFFLQDAEATTAAESIEKLVWPSHGFARLSFTAVAGPNDISLEVKGSRGTPLRVAALVLAPDTEAGRAFVDAHEKLQKKAVLVSFPPSDRSRRGAGRVAPSQPLVVQTMAPGAAMAPRDFPLEAAPPVKPHVAALGQIVAVQLGVYAQAAGTAEARASTLTGPAGATIAATYVAHGRYLPMRPLNQGPGWIQLDHYRPEPSFTLGPELSRAVLVEWQVPPNAKPGDYTGQIEIAMGDQKQTVPVTVTVVPVKLGALDKPVCFMRNALPFEPDVVGEERWWQLQEELLKQQGEAGMTCISGGPGLYYDVRDDGDKYVLGGDRPLRYIALAKKYGLDKAVLSYGAFLPPFRMGQLMLRQRKPADPKKLVDALTVLEHDKGLPPNYFYAYDEPQAEGERRRAADSIRPVSKVGGRTFGFTSVYWDQPVWRDLIEATKAPCLHKYVPEDVKKLRGMGKEPWIYAADHDRWAFGHGMWRALGIGVEGRLEWIGLISNGMAFDNFDARTAADVAWQVHDKFGVMPTPAWISSREGLYDLRARMTLEKAAKADDPALKLWSDAGAYTFDRGAWNDEQLEESRAAMLLRLAKLAPAKK